MARIRSIHPSLFTDEAWVSCTPLARILYIGLMTEADDQGLFEWKPIQIKLRLLGLDNVDIPALLEELRAVNLIAELTSGGKRLGAIRYFRRFQRPKKPNQVFVLPPEWATYVGLSAASTEPDDDEGEPVPHQFPPEGEKPPQREDGGGGREEIIAAVVERAPALAAAPDDWPPGSPADHMALIAEIVASPRLEPAKQPGLVTTLGRLAAWRRDGASWGFDVLPVVRGIAQKRGPPIGNWKYFDAAIAQSIADNRQALTIPEASHERTDHHHGRTTREDRRGVWAEVLAEERREGVG